MTVFLAHGAELLSRVRWRPARVAIPALLAVAGASALLLQAPPRPQLASAERALAGEAAGAVPIVAPRPIAPDTAAMPQAPRPPARLPAGSHRVAAIAESPAGAGQLHLPEPVVALGVAAVAASAVIAPALPRVPAVRVAVAPASAGDPRPRLRHRAVAPVPAAPVAGLPVRPMPRAAIAAAEPAPAPAPALAGLSPQPRPAAVVARSDPPARATPVESVALVVPAPRPSGLAPRVAQRPAPTATAALHVARVPAARPAGLGPVAQPAGIVWPWQRRPQAGRSAEVAPAPDRQLAAAGQCPATLARAIPDRPRGALPGSATVARLDEQSGAARDRLVTAELLSGNLPAFLRDLTPVTLTGRDAAGRPLAVTVCVMPDYLAVGSDEDFVRVPMGLPAAAMVADRFGFLLPTTRIVDAVFAQAGLRLAPRPMPAGDAMRTTSYFRRHNATVEDQRGAVRVSSRALVAGQKKDLVLTNALRSRPGRVAIYGWHQPGGRPIQPLSTVHGAMYADYSHGVRLVSRTAFVDGRAVALTDILADPAYADLLSDEGPIASPDRLLASLYR